MISTQCNINTKLHINTFIFDNKYCNHIMRLIPPLAPHHYHTARLSPPRKTKGTTNGAPTPRRTDPPLAASPPPPPPPLPAASDHAMQPSRLREAHAAKGQAPWAARSEPGRAQALTATSAGYNFIMWLQYLFCIRCLVQGSHCICCAGAIFCCACTVSAAQARYLLHKVTACSGHRCGGGGGSFSVRWPPLR